MHRPKVDLNIRLHFKNSKIHLQLQITPQIEKERLYGLTHHLVLIFQQISTKNSSALELSYSSLPNFKSVINGHNKNILNEPEKPSPFNCRDKTSCPLNGSC